MNGNAIKYVFWILTAILLILMLLLSIDAGINCDEVLHYNHSQDVYRYFASAGADHAALHTPVTHLQYYGQSYDNIVTILINWLNIVISKNDPVLFFAIVMDGSLVGSIGLVAMTDIYRKNFEMGYFLNEKHWGKGIITKAIRAATAYAFREFDVIRVYAEPFSDNPGSRRVLEKAGYIHEATFRKNVIKNGIIKDSCIYSILKENFRE